MVTFYPPMLAAFVPISSINRLATCSLCSRPGVPTGCNSASEYVDSNRSEQFCATATVSTDALLHSSKTLELRFFATDGVLQAVASCTRELILADQENRLKK